MQPRPQSLISRQGNSGEQPPLTLTEMFKDFEEEFVIIVTKKIDFIYPFGYNKRRRP